MKVRPVQGASDLRAFVNLPYRLHRHEPNWVAPLRFEVRARLSRKNPFFEHGEADYFLAERDGRVVGRIAAVANRLHNETHADRVGFFGFFESIDDAEVARALLDTASGWAVRKGFDVLRGPTSFSTNDECGLLVEGFATPPTLMMGHNPPYYPGLVESAGFTKVKDLVAYEYAQPRGVESPPERLAGVIERLSRRTGITIRGAKPKNFDDEVRRLQEGYNTNWERNWGFVPLTPSELTLMARQFKPIYVPELVPFAEKDGRIVGVGLALPDLNEVLRSNRSGRLFPAVLKIFWALRMKKITRMRMLMLGTLPEFRGKGVDAMLINWLWVNALERGVNWCEAGWILEDNAPMSNAMERLGFAPYKTYRLYDRPL